MFNVLIVDDEFNIRQTFSEFVNDLGHRTQTAKDGTEALKLIQTESTFAVIVSDMRMPRMNGIELLSQVRAISPTTVRIMLTGHADLDTSIEAVNEGNIFRFLTKPCSKKYFLQAVKDGLEQHKLITAEKVLLEKTLSGSVKMLTDVLSMADPDIFGFAMKLRKEAGRIAVAIKEQNTWQIELAAMLSQIGYVTLPKELREKAYTGQSLSPPERQMVGQVPEIGYKLISHIPRLEPVADIVRYQRKNVDGSGPPNSVEGKKEIPIGSRILRVLTDFAVFCTTNKTYKQAVDQLHENKNNYDINVLQAVINEQIFFQPLFDDEQTRNTISVNVLKLRVGDILATDLMTNDKKLLLTKGSEITEVVLERTINYAKLLRLNGVVRIWR
ncbi:MAG TPA: response regulator [bacterium]|nr:response regulator [bacterium]